MSYILDALKKLERERNLGVVPTIDTLHLPVHAPDARRSPWGLILGISIALVAGLCVMLWRFMPGVPETTTESTAAPTAVEEPPNAPPLKPKGAKTPQAIAKAESRPAPEKPKPSPAKRPPALAEQDQAPSPQPETRAHNEVLEIPADPNPQEPAPPPPPKTKPNRAMPDLAVRPTAPTPERIERLRAAMLRRQQEMSNRPPPPQSPPALPPVPAIPDVAMAEPPPIEERSSPPPKPSRAKPPEPNGLKNYREVAGSLGVPSLRINMLAYSDDSAERIVNINSQSYHEGEVVEGKVKIEGIVRDGAILSYQGQRFLLKP